MGTALSMAKNNDELVDNLITAKYLQSKDIIESFRHVDRGDFVSPSRREAAYADCAWKYREIHLSAPSIYSFALEALQIKRGMSFLNIGSGSGYLNTIAGLLVGECGINHGIELHKDVIIHAEVCIDSFVKNILRELKNASFCKPAFTHGNALTIIPNMLYDRIYVGAKCNETTSNYFKRFLKVDGCLILPVSNCLCLIQRISTSLYHWSAVSGVSFATLTVTNLKDSAAQKYLESLGQPLTLKELCKTSIRDLIQRETINRILEEKKAEKSGDGEDSIKERPSLRTFLLKRPEFPYPVGESSSQGIHDNKSENKKEQNTSSKNIDQVKREHMNNCSTCSQYAVQDNRNSDSDDDNTDETFEQLEHDIARVGIRFQWLLESMRDNFAGRNSFARRRRRNANHNADHNVNNTLWYNNSDSNESDEDVIKNDIENASNVITTKASDKTISDSNIKDVKIIEDSSDSVKEVATCSQKGKIREPEINSSPDKGSKRPSEFDNESESKRLGTSAGSSDEGHNYQGVPELLSSSSSSSSFSSVIMGTSSNDSSDSMESINSVASERFAQHLQLDLNNEKNISFLNYCKKEKIIPPHNLLDCDVSRDVDRYIKVFNHNVNELPLPELIKKYLMIELVM